MRDQKQPMGFNTWNTFGENATSVNTSDEAAFVITSFSTFTGSTVVALIKYEMMLCGLLSFENTCFTSSSVIFSVDTGSMFTMYSAYSKKPCEFVNW